MRSNLHLKHPLQGREHRHTDYTIFLDRDKKLRAMLMLTYKAFDCKLQMLKIRGK